MAIKILVLDTPDPKLFSDAKDKNRPASTTESGRQVVNYSGDAFLQGGRNVPVGPRLKKKYRDSGISGEAISAKTVSKPARFYLTKDNSNSTRTADGGYKLTLGQDESGLINSHGSQVVNSLRQGLAFGSTQQQINDSIVPNVEIVYVPYLRELDGNTDTPLERNLPKGPSNFKEALANSPELRYLDYIIAAERPDALNISLSFGSSSLGPNDPRKPSRWFNDLAKKHNIVIASANNNTLIPTKAGLPVLPGSDAQEVYRKAPEGRKNAAFVSDTVGGPSTQFTRKKYRFNPNLPEQSVPEAGIVSGVSNTGKAGNSFASPYWLGIMANVAISALKAQNAPLSRESFNLVIEEIFRLQISDEARVGGENALDRNGEFAQLRKDTNAYITSLKEQGHALFSKSNEDKRTLDTQQARESSNLELDNLQF